MPKIIAAPTNVPQIDYWNAVAGYTWAQFQEQLDQQISPLGRKAIEVLAPVSGEHVIDIGCGCGQTSVQLAFCVGASGRVLGVDVSRPMLEVARRRLPPIVGMRPEFQEIDAQSGAMQHAAFDAAFSRFGVMFFSDPVYAFANIRASLKPGGRLVFVCWRALEDNPWIGIPLQAVLELLPPLPPQDPLAPGPFVFADATRVRSILIEAGFTAVTIVPFDTRIGGASIMDTVRLSCRLGPVAAALREHPTFHDSAAAAVTRAVSPYDTSGGILMPAAVWIVSARNGESRHVDSLSPT